MNSLNIVCVINDCSLFEFKFIQILNFVNRMAPKRGKVQKEEVQVSLGPQVREGENVFGVAHIFASFNDTFVHVTDLSGR